MRRTIVHSNEDRAWILQKGREARQAGKPVYLETVQQPGAKEAFPRYLVWCEDCQEHSVTQPGGRYGRLACHGCGRVYGRMRPKPGDFSDRRIVILGLARLGFFIALVIAVLLILRRL